MRELAGIRRLRDSLDRLVVEPQLFKHKRLYWAIKADTLTV